MGTATTFDGPDPLTRFTTANGPAKTTVRCLICGWEATGTAPAGMQAEVDAHMDTHAHEDTAA